MLRNVDHPDFPHDYVRDFLGGSTPRPSNSDGEEEDLFRSETPPVRQPSFPPGHEDENVLEYVEDEIEVPPESPAPPGHTALAPDDSTPDRSGDDLRIASNTDVPFPHSGEELAKISKGFKREVMDYTPTLALQSHNDPPRPRHPLAQWYVPSSPGLVPRPEPQHLMVPHLIPHTPSPPRTTLVGKRKRSTTPEEEEYNDAGNIAGPSTADVCPGTGVPRQVKAGDNEDRVSPKKRKLTAHKPTWDLQTLVRAGFVPVPPQADPPASESSPDPSSQPVHVSPPGTATSQIQREDSELERSQVIEILSQEVEQGGSEDEEPTENILHGVGESRHSLPPLTADSSQSTTGANTQSEVGTPAGSQVPAEVQTSIPEDVFGPIVLSVKAKKISGAIEKGDNGGAVMSDFGHTEVSPKSARFSIDGRAKREEHKAPRKTPIRPGTSLRVTEGERAFVVEAEAENRDTLKPHPSPKKKRAVGTRDRKSKSTPSVEAEPTANPETGLLPTPAGKPPSKLRRGRSTSVQPEVPVLPKTPIRKSIRGRR